jgi:hypothetical protein
VLAVRSAYLELPLAVFLSLEVNLPRLSRLSEQPVGPESAILGAVPRRKESVSQTGLPFSRRAPIRERTLEVHCDNCQARFVAWYGTEEDADTETIDVEKCGLCGGRQL